MKGFEAYCNVKKMKQTNKKKIAIGFAIVILILLIAFIILCSLVGFNVFPLKKYNGTWTLNVFNEILEQKALYKYVRPNDVVLQLGGNIGTSCMLVDKLVHNKEQQMCVEPNHNIISTLQYNAKNTGSKFSIIPSIITNSSAKQSLRVIGKNHLGAMVVDNESDANVPITKVPLDELPFTRYNVLFADCEGCLCPFLAEYPDVLAKLRLVIFERDQAQVCNYENIDKLLIQNMFTRKQSGFINVWEKEVS
jgi:FkbM family methyltransferase